VTVRSLFKKYNACATPAVATLGVERDDMEQLERTAAQVASAISKVEGTADLKVEQTGGFPTLEMQFNRDAIARYSLSIEEVANTVAAGLGGREAGLVFEGDRRFDIVVRLDNVARASSAQGRHAGWQGSRPLRLPQPKPARAGSERWDRARAGHSLALLRTA
jgi:multidrug efflux pump subunit AcrB